MTSKFTAMQFTWLHQINEDIELPASDLKVALQLTRHFNEKEGGRAFPGYETLAEGCEPYTKDIGVSEHTVIRSVRRLQERGHLRVEWGKPGRGHPNQYWMIIKPASVQVSDAVKPASVSARKPASVSIKPAPVQENLLKNLEGVPKKEHPPGREREAELALSTAPDPGGTRLNGAPPDSASAPSEERKQARKKEPAADATVVSDYAELRKAWPRPWMDDDAADRRAFDQACRKALAGEIIQGALAYVQAFNDEPRYLPKLAVWLNGEGWTKKPPPKKSKPPGPNRRYRSNGGKPDMARIMFAQAGLIDAEEDDDPPAQTWEAVR
jgi:hypothetical protein